MALSRKKATTIALDPEADQLLTRAAVRAASGRVPATNLASTLADGDMLVTRPWIAFTVGTLR
jgi:hypothetical protein